MKLEGHSSKLLSSSVIQCLCCGAQKMCCLQSKSILLDTSFLSLGFLVIYYFESTTINNNDDISIIELRLAEGLDSQASSITIN